VAAIAALTVGVVAFSGWPGSPKPADRPALALGGAQSVPARAAAVASAALTAAAASAPGADAAATAAGTRARRTAGEGTDAAGASSSDGGGRAPTTVSSVGRAPDPRPVPASPLAPVADATDKTGEALAGSLQDSGKSLGDAAKPVNPTLADRVVAASDEVSNQVATTAKTVAETIRDLLPPTP